MLSKRCEGSFGMMPRGDSGSFGETLCRERPVDAKNEFLGRD
jgi:hypothetical protein